MSVVFNIIISPLVYIIENLFSIFYNVIELDIVSTVFSISFVVTLLCLPFYCRADKIKKEEDSKFLELKPFIDKIKRNFKGDELFFMLKTLYRQHDYNPIMALRNSFSLLLQIPFFIAAYHFFSSLDFINGYSVWIFSDLSKPDMLLNISNLKINVLPFIMTLINILSCEMYIKSGGIKERVQPYLLAIVFLVVLYNSPSILVLYWTCNNFFYLLKNKFMDSSPKIFWGILFILALSVLGIKFISVYYPKNGDFVPLVNLVIIMSLMIFLAARIIYETYIYVNNKFDKNNFFDILPNSSVAKIFISCGLGLVFLQGIIIPVGLLNSDLPSFVIEPSIMGGYIKILKNNTLCFLGLYLFWGSTILYLLKKEHKIFLIIGILSLYLFSLFNYIGFGRGLGTINVDLVFDQEGIVEKCFGDAIGQFVNIGIFIGVIALIIYAFKKSFIKQLTRICLAFLISELIFSGVCINDFFKGMKQIDKINISNNQTDNSTNKIELSRTGKNVIIIFLDRYLGAFLPMILEEKPELKKTYSGFVFYPNTVSYYHGTVLGYPPLVGGYEYTPYVLDKDRRNFSEKWLEATLMLLTLFKKNNYSSTVVDPVGDYDINMRFYSDDIFANIYSSRGINYLKVVGKYNTEFKLKTDESNRDEFLKQMQKKIYVYSFFNVAAKCLKSLIYDNGYYLSANKRNDKNTYQNLYLSEYAFISAYSSLLYTKDKISFKDNGNTFTLINNDLPHNMHLFQYPDYEYRKEVTCFGENRFKNEKTFMAYHTAMASILLVGKYLDKLKEFGVYDNTRIIVASDHGNMFVRLPQFTEFQNDNVIPFNPLLLVKDFNQNFELKNDETFMTNADVPYIATKDIVDAINPFTGKKISTEEKLKGVDIYMDTNFWNASHFNSDKVILEARPKIKHVHGNIFDQENWRKVIFKRN